MAIEWEFRRHSIRDAAVNDQMIGPLGYELARRVGEKQLRGRKFDCFCVSSLYRTHQTLAAFVEGAGDFDLTLAPPIAPLDVVSPDTRTLWRACREAQRRGEDLVEAVFVSHARIAEKVASQIADLFKTWSSSFADGSRILVVGHSPALELMLFGVTGTKIPSLNYCEGFRIIEKGGSYEVTHGIDELSPTELIKLPAE